MTPQVPSSGILLQSEFENSKTYLVTCECTDPDHAHLIDVSVEKDIGIAVQIWTTVETPVWSKSRWKLIWELLSKGTTKYNASLLLREQQAINYAAVINDAIADFKTQEKE